MGKTRVVTCDYCDNEFSRPTGRANEAERNGWKQFCSKDCHRLSKTKRRELNCSECGIEITVRNNEFEKSKTKRFFCTKSCAAKYNNSNRKHTEETKEKIRNTTINRLKNVFKKYKIKKTCPICNEGFEVTQSQKYRIYCSVDCGRIGTTGSLPFTKEEVIEQIKSHYDKYGTAPSSKRVKTKLVGAAMRFFGSWNKTMLELDIKPNTEWMAKKRLKCKDGHVADSISEFVVDNWLYENDIKHEIHKKYPGYNYNCDFYLTELDIWLEYFGLAGEHKSYDLAMNKKKDIASKLGLKFVGLLPGDIFPEIKIGEILMG